MNVDALNIWFQESISLTSSSWVFHNLLTDSSSGPNDPTAQGGPQINPNRVNDNHLEWSGEEETSEHPSSDHNDQKFRRDWQLRIDMTLPTIQSPLLNQETLAFQRRSLHFMRRVRQTEIRKIEPNELYSNRIRIKMKTKTYWRNFVNLLTLIECNY